MSDLIKRSDAIDGIKKMFAKSLARERAIDAVNSVPSAEPEIIRCKDCKYWEESFPFDLCMLTKAKNNIWRSDETDFCSWAERREK